MVLTFLDLPGDGEAREYCLESSEWERFVEHHSPLFSPACTSNLYEKHQTCIFVTLAEFYLIKTRWMSIQCGPHLTVHKWWNFVFVWFPGVWARATLLLQNLPHCPEAQTKLLALIFNYKTGKLTKKSWKLLVRSMHLRRVMQVFFLVCWHNYLKRFVHLFVTKAINNAFNTGVSIGPEAPGELCNKGCCQHGLLNITHWNVCVDGYCKVCKAPRVS